MRWAGRAYTCRSSLEGEYFTLLPVMLDIRLDVDEILYMYDLAPTELFYASLQTMLLRTYHLNGQQQAKIRALILKLLDDDMSAEAKEIRALCLVDVDVALPTI